MAYRNCRHKHTNQPEIQKTASTSASRTISAIAELLVEFITENTEDISADADLMVLTNSSSDFKLICFSTVV